MLKLLKYLAHNQQHRILEGEPDPAAPPIPGGSPPADLPAGNQLQAAPEPPPTADPPPAPIEEPIQIGDKKFATMEEAFQYVGSNSAPGPTPAPVQVVPISQIPQFAAQQPSNTEPDLEKRQEEFLNDPAQYVDRAVKAATDKVTAKFQQERQEAESDVQAYNFMWKRHPDLENKRDIVDMMAAKFDNELKSFRTMEERSDILALRTRQYLTSLGVPVTALSELQKTNPQNSDGSSHGVTPPPADGESLSMADQLVKMQTGFGY